MTQRLRVHPKFRWRGWTFRLERATSREARWCMNEGKKRIRVIYRAPLPADEFDAETLGEWTAVIVLHGLGDLSGSGVSDHSVEEALDRAERDFCERVVNAIQLVRELKRGKEPDQEP